MIIILVPGLYFSPVSLLLDTYRHMDRTPEFFINTRISGNSNSKVLTMMSDISVLWPRELYEGKHVPNILRAYMPECDKFLTKSGLCHLLILLYRPN